MGTTEELDSRYRVKAPLRCDGVGALHCAEELATGARIAIRYIPLEANGERALRAIRSLPEHPSLPRILATGATPGAAYVAMDFPEGPLLSKADPPVSIDRLALLGASIADALAVLHEADIFHGELSGESILVMNNDQAMLWDLPLVLSNRYTDRRKEARALSRIANIALSLSPERARGTGPAAASDVYALGVALTLAAGAPRPDTRSTLELLHRIASGSWRPQMPEGSPPALIEAVEAMTELEPTRRPAARECAEILRSAAEATAHWPSARELPAFDAPVTPARNGMREEEEVRTDSSSVDSGWFNAAARVGPPAPPPDATEDELEAAISAANELPMVAPPPPRDASEDELEAAISAVNELPGDPAMEARGEEIEVPISDFTALDFAPTSRLVPMPVEDPNEYSFADLSAHDTPPASPPPHDENDEVPTASFAIPADLLAIGVGQTEPTTHFSVPPELMSLAGRTTSSPSVERVHSAPPVPDEAEAFPSLFSSALGSAPSSKRSRRKEKKKAAVETKAADPVPGLFGSVTGRSEARSPTAPEFPIPVVPDAPPAAGADPSMGMFSNVIGEVEEDPRLVALAERAQTLAWSSPLQKAGAKVHYRLAWATASFRRAATIVLVAAAASGAGAGLIRLIEAPPPAPKHPAAAAEAVAPPAAVVAPANPAVLGPPAPPAAPTAAAPSAAPAVAAPAVAAPAIAAPPAALVPAKGTPSAATVPAKASSSARKSRARKAQAEDTRSASETAAEAISEAAASAAVEAARTAPPAAKP